MKIRDGPAAVIGDEFHGKATVLEEWEGVEGERSESQKTYLDFCSCSPEKKRTTCNLGDDRDILDQLFNWSGIFVFQTVKRRRLL